MKKNILLLCLLCSGKIFAQTPEDALKYSWYPQNATARIMAVGGAMGSLGGDITATFVNPAGLGFYKTGDFVLTPGFLSKKNDADYFNNHSSVNKSSFNLGPSGFVIGGPTQSGKSASFSLAVNQSVSFNNSLHLNALNNKSSFSEQFAEEFANSGLSIDGALNVNSSVPYGAAPALYTYLIDTVTVAGNTTIKAAPEYILDAGQALRQDMYKQTNGGIYEVAIGGAIDDNDKWMYGASIGIPIVYYKSNTTFTESDTSSNTSNYFNSFKYNDTYTTTGGGVNLKLGAIFRPQEYLRFGLAIHTPSFMWLHDKRVTTLNTQIENPVLNSSSTSLDFTNNEPGVSKYIQSSPWKAILSGSYVFRETQDVTRQRAFITADVEYVNYKGSRFHADNSASGMDYKSYYNGVNDVIKSDYKGAFNFRAGGELKFNTFMVRGGFAYYSSPYADASLKASQALASGGIGYRNKGVFIDLTYIHNITKDINFPYRLETGSYYATTQQKRDQVVATVGFKF
ncbi:MAG: hypothetical protein JSU03_10870 [Bacteroidetes bacterium]|nr:hypothetical protein [Bacteroidota bacterium]MBS1757771.1 hypothetical protein [Bacteroidota bacterium]